MNLEDTAEVAATTSQALPLHEAPSKVAVAQWASKPVASLEACRRGSSHLRGIIRRALVSGSGVWLWDRRATK